MAFRIGQKVVCVESFGNQVVKGRIYTVVDLSCINDGWLRVDYWVNNQPGGNGYHHTRFRPVIEKQTDITAFTEILDRENKNCRVPVSDHQSN